MSSITRANPYLVEIIEILDMHLAKYQGDKELARDHLSRDDNQWIDDEILHCIRDRRYFLSNYYAYRDEQEGFKGLYPFFDSQEILYEEFERLRKTYGKVRALVLKARQMGSTTFNCGEIFHETIFYEHRNGILVGKDEKQKNKMFSMYSSALDFIPWWMRPRHKTFVTGETIEFDEKDEAIRSVRPGLKTIVNWENANKPSGAGRGDTFNCALLSELSFWTNGSQLSKSLFPTFNTDDGFYVMESTANGRNDFWHNLWRRAEAGRVDWHPIFIPFYRREKTYSMPILKTEVFVLTDEEKGMRERIFSKESFLIKDETFKWMRNKKEEFIATDGDDSMFSQEYTSEPEESFQTSAVTAFPRGVIRRLSKNTHEPLWIGEITYDHVAGKPKLRMKEVGKDEEVPYPETGNRFHIWEKPVHGARYSMGVDVALGNPGGDYSCVQVLKLSDTLEKDEQVAMWHGWINPTALAEIVLAIGWYYNGAMAAVEVNSYGMQTNSVLMREHDYENIYRFKRLDRLGSGMTNIIGFYSDVKSTDALMAKMSEYLMDDVIRIHCRFTVDEFNDYTEQGALGEGAHDDMVDALMIALYCGHEGQVRERREGTRKTVDPQANKFFVLDRFGTIMLETTSQAEAERMSKKHIGTQITRQAGATANVILGGRKRQVPADLQNTDFSPIFDKPGTAHDLYHDEGVAPEDITPEMMQEYEAEQELIENSEDAWKYL